MTQPLPPIEDLDFEALMTLRRQIDTRLDTIRGEFIERAGALGLSVVNGEGKKRKRRASVQKEHD
jgi:hypothetical protein